MGFSLGSSFLCAGGIRKRWRLVTTAQNQRVQQILRIQHRAVLLQLVLRAVRERDIQDRDNQHRQRVQAAHPDHRDPRSGSGSSSSESQRSPGEVHPTEMLTAVISQQSCGNTSSRAFIKGLFLSLPGNVSLVTPPGPHGYLPNI